jgi:hypothetical protein
MCRNDSHLRVTAHETKILILTEVLFGVKAHYWRAKLACKRGYIKRWDRSCHLTPANSAKDFSWTSAQRGYQPNTSYDHIFCHTLFSILL